MKLRLRISSRAWVEIDRASRWWRRNRDKAPHAFDEDLFQALDRIRSDPGVGKRIPARRPGLRVLWLDRIGYFVYYSVTDHDIVEIAAIWHAARGSRPRL